MRIQECGESNKFFLSDTDNVELQKIIDSIDSVRPLSADDIISRLRREKRKLMIIIKKTHSMLKSNTDVQSIIQNIESQIDIGSIP